MKSIRMWTLLSVRTKSNFHPYWAQLLLTKYNIQTKNGWNRCGRVQPKEKSISAWNVLCKAKIVRKVEHVLNSGRFLKSSSPRQRHCETSTAICFSFFFIRYDTVGAWEPVRLDRRIAHKRQPNTTKIIWIINCGKYCNERIVVALHTRKIVYLLEIRQMVGLTSLLNQIDAN